MNGTNGSAAHRDSPYFGLDYYEEKYGTWFFGREIEGGKIITNMRAARLTLLHAESGVGKSSLLRAGVAWRMRRLADDSLARRGTARSIPIVFSSWKDDPVHALIDEIRTAIGPYVVECPEPDLPAGQLDAAVGAASGAVNASLLIMLDQFEEYFLYRSREPTPERFADELARCINRSDLRANFLIAIREDAYAGLGDLFKGRIANVYGNYLHVEYLDRESAEKAIRKPLDIYNSQPGVPEVRIQDELVEAVLDQVRAFDGDGDAGATATNGDAGATASKGDAGDRVATPLLQLVMETVWKQERADGSHELRLSTLQDLHGVKMIVDAHLGKALSSLSASERQTAIDMFDHLVTPSGGKIAESVPDLALRTGHAEDQVGGVLDKLDHERIVRPVPAAPGQDPVRFRRYEIFHDELAPTINRAIAAREERRRARKLRRFTALAVGLLVVALAVVGVFIALLNRANNEKQIAESRQLAADADVNIANDPDLSALLAMQALHVHYTSQAEDALRAALPGIQQVKTFEDGTTVFSAAFDPADENKIASADLHGIVWVWDVRTGHRVRLSLKGGFSAAGSADAVAFNPAGTEVAVGYADGLVALFRASDGKKLPPQIKSESVNDLRFIGHTGYLAIATRHGTFLWLPGKGYYRISSTAASTIAVNAHNPNQWAGVTSDGTVIWTITDSGKVRHRLLPQGGWSTNDAVFSPDGREIATAGADGNVRVYDLATSGVITTLNAGEADALSVAFSPDGQQLVAGYSSGRARVWDVSTRLQLAVLTAAAGGYTRAQFSANGHEVVTASSDGTISVWRSQPRELEKEFASSSTGGTPNPVGGAVYSTDGRKIFAVDNAGHLYVFTPAGQRQAVINPGSAVDWASFSNAGAEIVTANADGTVDVWQAAGAQYTQVHFPSPIRMTGGPAQSVDISPDGTRIVIVSPDGYTVQVRDARTGQLLHAIHLATAASVVAFAPSGRQIFTGDINGQVEVWSAATWRKLRVLGTRGQAIDTIGFDASGSKFVTAPQSGAVTVWATRDGRPGRPINVCPSFNTVSLSPDGSKIVAACGDGGAPVFDAATGKQLIVLPAASSGAVGSASFSPDGKRIITAIDAGNVGGIQIWNSELATPSRTRLMQLARQRVTGQLTPAERQEYLAGISG
jgi:WD40 repeat protein